MCRVQSDDCGVRLTVGRGTFAVVHSHLCTLHSAPSMTPKSPSDSFTETVHVVLPNDANPLGFILGGTVMHLIDMAGAIAALRHARVPIVTAAVDDLQFLHPIKVGDLIILRARVNAAFTTSMEVEVEVFSEETLTGARQLTSRAFLTFVTVDKTGGHRAVPPLLLETDEERARAAAAKATAGGATEAARGVGAMGHGG